MSFCSYLLFAKNKLKLFRFFEIAVITLNNYFGSLDLDNNSLVNNSFLAFLSASLYSVFKVHFSEISLCGGLKWTRTTDLPLIRRTL